MKILEYFPIEIGQLIQNNIEQFEMNELEEIRIRVSKPIILKLANREKIINYKVSTQDILKILENITENSLYSYQKQICSGYISLKGGHRVGITGNVVMEDEKVININYIYSLNFRIAKQVLGAADYIKEKVIENNNIYNTLIVSPPGAGKTTILRDLIRQISKNKTIGVVDERGEIAAMYKGIPKNDIGENTDVIDNIPKDRGMRILVRSMSPEVIACDEIGSYEDVCAIDYAMCSGVKGIFTAHGEDIEEINKNPELSKLMQKHVFERIVVLNPQKLGETRCIHI